MNNLTLLLGVLLCLVAVNARHYGDRNNLETLENEEETLRRPKEHNSESRHRRRRWQTNYGYDYPPPNYHYPERRDYDRQDQVVLQQITKLLEEISAYIRRPPPPPPPQPIYIPYPVPFNYPQVQQIPCNPSQTNEMNPKVNATSRDSFKDMDPNQIWGVAVSKENDYDDGSDGSRPISFDPIVAKQFMKRPSPRVDHGSVQASITTVPPRFLEVARVPASMVAPSMCNAAILSCCGMSNSKEQQKQCFGNVGCEATYANGNACDPATIKNALDSFTTAYSPLN